MVLNEDRAAVLDLLPTASSGLNQPPDCRQLRATFLTDRRKLN
ncbi:hypothetical protein [Rhizobium leguminosarum]|nr:hypothetical protein [Rhizobium leguminosarum]